MQLTTEATWDSETVLANKRTAVNINILPTFTLIELQACMLAKIFSHINSNKIVTYHKERSLMGLL